MEAILFSPKLSTTCSKDGGQLSTHVERVWKEVFTLQSHFLAQLEDPEKHRKKDPLFLPDVALCRGKPRTRKAVS